MNRQIPISTLLSFALIFSFSAVGQAQEISVDGAFGPPNAGSDPTHAYRAQSLKQDYSSTPIALRITLPAVTDTEQTDWDRIRREQAGPMPIGFGREIPAAYQDDLAPRLEWTTVSDGTLVSALSVTSPGARALRIAVFATLPTGAELRFFSLTDRTQDFERLTQHDFAHQTSESTPVWSSVLEGQTGGLEIILPSSESLSTFSLYVDQVSHLVSSMVSSVPQFDPQQLSGIGQARCHAQIDVQCANVDIQAQSTAKMVFVKSGNSFLCTGTLMNSKDGSFTPYFLTAHHCISTQVVAQSVLTYWDFERASCGGPAPRSVTELRGGADLLVTRSESDSSLLRLRRSPGTRSYSGWDAAEVSRTTRVFGVHHPRGDLKKYSTGTGISRPFSLDGDQDVSEGLIVTWSQGTTEQGSSGSGLFDQSGRLRGTLSGGRGCSPEAAYGSFAGFYSHARRWLSEDAPPPPPRDDHPNTPDRATSVTPGSSTRGHLERQGDNDYFRVRLSRPGSLTVYTTGNTDTYGILWHNSQRLESDDDGGAGYNFRIERLVSAGTYNIQVRGYDNKATGRYTLAVGFTPSTSSTNWNTVYWAVDRGGCYTVAWSFNNSTQQRAETGAQTECRDSNECDDTCDLALTWSGNSCFSFARGGENHLFLVVRRTEAEAESAALRNCRDNGYNNCELRGTYCP